MSLTDYTGMFGVALILLAYLLNITGKLTVTSSVFLLINGSGALLACWSSYLLGSVPFMILEGTWSVVSFVALLRSRSS